MFDGSADSERKLSPHCHVLLERLPDILLLVYLAHTERVMELKMRRKELESYVHIPPRKGKRSLAQTTSLLETLRKKKLKKADKSDYKGRVHREKKSSNEDKDKRKHFAGFSCKRNRAPTRESDETTEKTRLKHKKSMRNDRILKQESTPKPGHLKKEGKKLLKESDGQTKSKLKIFFGYQAYVSLFESYLSAVIANENNIREEIQQRNLKEFLFIKNEKREPVLNRTLVKWILEIVGKEGPLEDEWIKIESAATEAVNNMSMECEENKNSQKGMSNGSYYSFTPNQADLLPSVSVEAAKPINNCSCECPKQTFNGKENFQISSAQSNRNSLRTAVEVPLLEEGTSADEAIDTNKPQVSTIDWETATSSILPSSIMTRMNATIQHSEEPGVNPLPSESKVSTWSCIQSSIRRPINEATQQLEEKHETNALSSKRNMKSSSSLQSSIMWLNDATKQSTQKPDANPLRSERNVSPSSNVQSSIMRPIMGASKHPVQKIDVNPLPPEKSLSASKNLLSSMMRPIIDATKHSGQKTDPNPLSRARNGPVSKNLQSIMRLNDCSKQSIQKPNANPLPTERNVSTNNLQSNTMRSINDAAKPSGQNTDANPLHSDRNVSTSSNLQSNIIKPINEATKHSAQKTDPNPLPSERDISASRNLQSSIKNDAEKNSNHKIDANHLPLERIVSTFSNLQPSPMRPINDSAMKPSGQKTDANPIPREENERKFSDFRSKDQVIKSPLDKSIQLAENKDVIQLAEMKRLINLIRFMFLFNSLKIKMIFNLLKIKLFFHMTGRSRPL